MKELQTFFYNYLQPTGTVYSMWAIMGLLVLFSFICTRKMKKDEPGKLQNIAEMVVSSLLNFFSGIMGEKNARKYFPVLATFFIFIIVSNYSGLIPGAGHLFTIPTSVIAVTAALGVLAFITIHTTGIKEKGVIHYLKSFTKPVILLLPITLIEQFVRPLSLALRLYGNIYGEEEVTGTLTGLFPVLLPLVMQVFSLLFCLIQAMIFTMLLSVFISEAVEEEEE